MVEILAIGSSEIIDGFRLAGIKGIVENDPKKIIQIIEKEKADIYIVEGKQEDFPNIKDKNIIFLYGEEDPIELAKRLLDINI